ncbi:MAG TPA: hypothetical protein PLU80_13150, partial [Acidobacteriota bacterium]|nr:hypothetical protein [Acidobacteriota bacterium]
PVKTSLALINQARNDFKHFGPLFQAQRVERLQQELFFLIGQEKTLLKTTSLPVPKVEELVHLISLMNLLLAAISSGGIGLGLG